MVESTSGRHAGEQEVTERTENRRTDWLIADCGISYRRKPRERREELSFFGLAVLATDKIPSRRTASIFMQTMQRARLEHVQKLDELGFECGVKSSLPSKCLAVEKDRVTGPS